MATQPPVWSMAEKLHRTALANSSCCTAEEALPDESKRWRETWVPAAELDGGRILRW